MCSLPSRALISLLSLEGLLLLSEEPTDLCSLLKDHDVWVSPLGHPREGRTNAAGKQAAKRMEIQPWHKETAAVTVHLASSS